MHSINNISCLDILIIILIVLIVVKIFLNDNQEHLILLRKHDPTYIANKFKIKNFIKLKTTPVVKYNSRIQRTIDENIPKDVYMVWHTNNLPPKMKFHLDECIKNNRELTFHIYNSDDCRNYIIENFDHRVVNAYDRLNPIAYKVDLFRYCVMYKSGGIYVDIKMMPVDGFKFIDVMDKERFTLERDAWYRSVWMTDSYGICNAFIIAKPNNEIFLDCIENIVDNVDNDFYGFNDLYPTGPGLLGKIYFEHKKTFDDFDLFFVGMVDGNYTIQLNNSIILQSYPEYSKERSNGGKQQYGTIYNNRQIYL